MMATFWETLLGWTTLSPLMMLPWLFAISIFIFTVLFGSRSYFPIVQALWEYLVKNTKSASIIAGSSVIFGLFVLFNSLFDIPALVVVVFQFFFLIVMLGFLIKFRRSLGLTNL